MITITTFKYHSMSGSQTSICPRHPCHTVEGFQQFRKLKWTSFTGFIQEKFGKWCVLEISPSPTRSLKKLRIKQEKNSIAQRQFFRL